MIDIRHKKYRMTIFIYIFITAIVPLFILGTYSYHSAKQTVRENVRQANETALIQLENKVDNILDGVRQNFFRLAVSNQTGRIIDQKMDELNYKELGVYINEIGQNQAYIGYVKGYTVVNFKNNWALSNRGIIGIDEAENKDELEEFKSRKEKVFWINHSEEENEKEIDGNHINTGYISFVVKMPVYTAADNAAFIINLDRSSIERILTGSLGNSSLTIFDEYGKLVFTENSAIAQYYISNPKELESSDKQIVKAEKTGYDIVKRRSGSSSWTFIASYNSSAASDELTPILVTMGGIILVILIIVGGISIFGTTKVYRPISDLVSSFKGIVSDTDEEDEIGFINQGISQLMGNNEQLQRLIDRQMNQLQELFGLRLIRGVLKKSEIIQTRERLNVMEEPFFCVISVVFCQKSSKTGKGQMEQDAMNLEMMKNMPEEMKSLFALPPFIYTRAIVLVLECSVREKMEEKILALRNCMSIYVNSSDGGSVDMGVSRLFEDIIDFRKAYQESLEALKINQYYGHEEEDEGISFEESSITYYADLIQKCSSSSEYNLSLDAAVSEAVDTCNKEAAFKAVDQFMRETSKNGFVLYEQQFYLHRFLMTILSVPVHAGIPVREMFPEGEANLFFQFNQLYDSNSIREFYENQVIVPVIGYLEKFRKSSSEVVLDKIMNLVQQTKGDITLAECAEELGYHPSYIWRVMKNTRDITFTDYLAEQKIEMAKEMLIKTQMSISEIAENLNYSNAQNFIRLFKKHMDITPGQYRKNVKKNEE